jgi:hypothetical protein
MSTETMVSTLRERRLSLGGERRDVAARIQTEQARYTELTEELDRIEGLLEFYGALDPVPVDPTPPSPTPEPPADGAWRAEAVRILEEHGGPLHYRELYHMLAVRGFPFGGRTPEAVLLSSLSRARTTFTAVGRGGYWLTGVEIPAAASQAWGPARRPQRPQPIGRRGKRGST